MNSEFVVQLVGFFHKLLMPGEPRMPNTEMEFVFFAGAHSGAHVCQNKILTKRFEPRHERKCGFVHKNYSLARKYFFLRNESWKKRESVTNFATNSNNVLMPPVISPPDSLSETPFRSSSGAVSRKGPARAKKNVLRSREIPHELWKLRLGFFFQKHCVTGLDRYKKGWVEKHSKVPATMQHLHSDKIRCSIGGSKRNIWRRNKLWNMTAQSGNRPLEPPNMMLSSFNAHAQKNNQYRRILFFSWNVPNWHDPGTFVDTLWTVLRPILSNTLPIIPCAFRVVRLGASLFQRVSSNCRCPTFETAPYPQTCNNLSGVKSDGFRKAETHRLKNLYVRFRTFRTISQSSFKTAPFCRLLKRWFNYGMQQSNLVSNHFNSSFKTLIQLWDVREHFPNWDELRIEEIHFRNYGTNLISHFGFWAREKCPLTCAKNAIAATVSQTAPTDKYLNRTTRFGFEECFAVATRLWTPSKIFQTAKDWFMFFFQTCCEPFVANLSACICKHGPKCASPPYFDPIWNGIVHPFGTRRPTTHSCSDVFLAPFPYAA